MVDISQGVIVSGRTFVLPQAVPQLGTVEGAKSARSEFQLAGDALRMTGPVRLRPVVAPTGDFRVDVPVDVPVVNIPGSVPGGLTV